MLDSIRLMDFCCYEDVTFKIGRAGLVLVTGRNEDSEGADSNGSGKSTFFKGIGWALYGESIDAELGDDLDNVIRRGAREASSLLKFADGHLFRRTRRKGVPNLTGVDPDGNAIDLKKKELQEYLEKLFGMDWIRFRNTVLFGQRDTKRFLAPTTSDADRKDLLHKILGTELFKRAHDIAKKDALELKHEVEATKVKIETLTKQLEAVDLDSLKADHDDWDERRAEELTDLKRKAKALLDEADKMKPDDSAPLEAERVALKATIATLPALKTEHSEASGKIDKLADRRRKLESEFASLIDEHDRFVEEITALKSGKGRCPVCNSDLGSGDAADHLKSLRAKMLKAKTASVEKNSDVEAAAANLYVAKELRRDVERRIAVADKARDRLASVDAALAELKRVGERAAEKRDSARTYLERARTKADEANPFVKRLEKTKADVKKWKTSRRIARAELESQQGRLSDVQFWVKGYSPEGLPSWALDSVMPYLTERANKHLDTLADGDITLVFNTQSELKSTKGAVRDRISVDWTIEGVEGAAPSGGQWRKMEVATDLAFMDLSCGYGANPDLLLMDEIFDGLDSEGQSRVIDLLKKLRKKRASVFVISHDARIAESFEKELRFVKSEGVSSIEEV